MWFSFCKSLPDNPGNILFSSLHITNQIELLSSNLRFHNQQKFDDPAKGL